VADRELPDVAAVSRGAVGLLALASGAFGDPKRQRRFDVSESAALRYAFEICGALPHAARAFDTGDETLLVWMDAVAPPPHLFAFCGWLADGIHRRICDRHATLRPKPSDATTDFDHAAYLAIGQTLAGLMGMAGGTGPRFAQIVERVSLARGRALQEHLMRNYIGNILQDYFDQAQIRLQHPNLPDTTEPELRSVDAELIARILFDDIGPGGEPLSWNIVRLSFRRLLTAVALAERAPA
jgi:hypothetical protein